MIDFSNPYSIQNVEILKIPNDAVVKHQMKSGKWLSHFYLTINFNSKQDFDVFGSFVAKDWDESVNSDIDKNAILKSETLYEYHVPLPTKWYKTHIAAYGQKTERLLNFLSTECQYDFKKDILMRDLEQRKLNQWGMFIGGISGYLAAALYIVRYSIYTITSPLLFATSGLVGGYLLNRRDQFKIDCNEEYLNKDEQALNELSESQRKAFDLGVQAADSYVVQFMSCVTPNGVMHPKAYYAGMVAKQIDSPSEQALRDKLKV